MIAPARGPAAAAVPAAAPPAEGLPAAGGLPGALQLTLGAAARRRDIVEAIAGEAAQQAAAWDALDDADRPDDTARCWYLDGLAEAAVIAARTVDPLEEPAAARVVAALGHAGAGGLGHREQLDDLLDQLLDTACAAGDALGDVDPAHWEFDVHQVLAVLAELEQLRARPGKQVAGPAPRVVESSR